MKLEYRIEKTYLENKLRYSYFEINTKDMSEEEIDLLIKTFEPDIFGTWLMFEEKDEILVHGYYPIDLKDYSEEEVILRLAILGYEAIKIGEKENYRKIFDDEPLNLEDIL